MVDPIMQSPAPLTPPPEPSPVVRAFGGATVGYECGVCEKLHLIPKEAFLYLQGKSCHQYARDNAFECCGLVVCQEHNRTMKHGWSCSDCRVRDEEARERVKFEKATKIPLSEYKENYLYREGFGNDGYFQDEDFEDLQANDKAPEWAFACEPQTITKEHCDLTDHVAESILSDFHEDAIDSADMDKIDQASALVFEALKDVKSYLPDESTVVILKPAPVKA